MTMALDRILAGERLRPIDQRVVDLYAETMAARGCLDQPITVRPIATPANGCDHKLVAGGHRLAAARKLGWAEIAVTVNDYANEDEARLAEIAENLIRADLNPLDRAIHLAELKQVWERLHPEAKRGGDRRSTKRQEAIKPQTLPFGFSREAAATIGLSDRTVRDAVQIAEALIGDIADLLRRAPVDLKGAQLRALAKLPATERRTAAAHLSDGRAKSFDAALAAVGRKAPPMDGQEQLYRALVSLWGRTSAKTRKRFLAHIGGGRP